MRPWRTPLATTLALGLLAASAACQDAGAPATSHPVSLRVLFIGNSLTYVNDLPGTVAVIARSGGDTIRVEMVARPNYALIDHLTEKSGAEEAIRRGGWDVVVLQQGPTSLPVNRDSLILWTRMFDPLIRAVGARTALYMVWPAADRPQDFQAVRTSFQMAAQAVGGIFLPAGQAWLAAWQRNTTLPLYGSDGFHPSPLGTYLAALTIYEALTGHDARRLPPTAVVNGVSLDLPARTVRLLQEAAHQAVTED
jgi:hypothetical protein